MTGDDVQSEYERLAYSAGWRFLTAPKVNLTEARTAIITLNPGGERNLETSVGERWSNETGSAYRVESWDGQPGGADKLQRQHQRLCVVLEENIDEVLQGHFVPFRSKNWSALLRRDEAAAFGARLWRWALSISPARLIVCIGKDVVGRGIAAAVGAESAGHASSGWGDILLDRYVAPDGRKVIALPHLSRFGLFGDSRREQLFHTALEF